MVVALKEIEWEKILGYYDIGDDYEQIEKFLDDGWTIVHCDASYKNRWGSCSVQIKKKNREYAIKKYKFRSRGPNHSESKSIVYGLRELQKIKGVKKAIILNDNYYAVNLAVGNFSPRKPHIKRVVGELENEKEKLDCDLHFGKVKSKINKKVDKSAKRVLKKKEAEIKDKIEERINSIKMNIEKSKKLTEYKKIDNNSVEIKSENSEKWYTVHFYPVPSCSCPWWSNNWDKKELKIIKSRALPCKHMCKAAEVLGINIFDIFRKQIFRRY